MGSFPIAPNAKILARNDAVINTEISSIETSVYTAIANNVFDVTIADTVFTDITNPTTTQKTITINLTTNIFTASTHGLNGLDKVQILTDDQLPSPLVVNTDYWIIRIDANTFKLGSTLRNAELDIEIVVDPLSAGAPFTIIGSTVVASSQNTNVTNTGNVMQIDFAGGGDNAVPAFSKTVIGTVTLAATVLDISGTTLIFGGTGDQTITFTGNHTFDAADINATANIFSILNHVFVDDDQITLTANGVNPGDSLPHDLNDGTTYYIVNAADTATFTATNATNILTSATHGLADGELLRISNSGGALPNGLLTATDYYVINQTASTFQVSLTSGGAAVTFSDDGTGTHTWVSHSFQVSLTQGGAAIDFVDVGQGTGHQITKIGLLATIVRDEINAVTGATGVTAAIASDKLTLTKNNATNAANIIILASTSLVLLGLVIGTFKATLSDIQTAINSIGPNDTNALPDLVVTIVSNQLQITNDAGTSIELNNTTGTPVEDIGFVDGQVETSTDSIIKVIDARDYYSVWQGIKTDLTFKERMDFIINHFTNLKYTILRETNTATNVTMQWHIYWS